MSAVITACFPSRLNCLLKVTAVHSSFHVPEHLYELRKIREILLFDHLHNLTEDTEDPQTIAFTESQFPIQYLSQKDPLYLGS